MEPINMHEILERGPQDKMEALRVELFEKVNALGIGAQALGGHSTVLDVKDHDLPDACGFQARGDHPELRRHAARAFRARRLRHPPSSSRRRWTIGRRSIGNRRW